MSGRRSKSNKRHMKKRDIIGSAIVLCCIAGLVAIFAFGTKGDFISNLKNIWYNTIDHASGYATVDKQAEALANLTEHGNELILYTIDTGNSDCMVIRAPEGDSMLVDAADSDDYANISGTLKALGIEQLNAVLATHPDADHIGSMSDVIGNFSPSVLYLTSYEKNTATYDRMIKQANDSGVSLVKVTAPYQFNLGSVDCTVLNPQSKPYDSANESSIVLLLKYGENKILLTGDIEEQSLEEILSAYPDLIDVDVLKIAHHGSADSTSQEWLTATTPALAIITAGANNDYGHPHKETLTLLDQNGIATLRTDQNGDIAIFADGTSIEYATAA